MYIKYIAFYLSKKAKCMACFIVYFFFVRYDTTMYIKIGKFGRGDAALNLPLHWRLTFCFQNTFLCIYILKHMHLHTKYALAKEKLKKKAAHIFNNYG
jgi:hypothetical protein